MRRTHKYFLALLAFLIHPGIGLGQDQMVISGIVFHDVNADSSIDSGEPLLAGWIIYADDNNNGILDPGESFTSTDAFGQFTLITKKRCTNIRIVIQPGWTITYPRNAPYYRICDNNEVIFGVATADFDFGDLPDPPYRTRLANNGPRHKSDGPYFGNLRDEELDALPDNTATGDDVNNRDDEDGIEFTQFDIGGTGTVNVTVNGVTHSAYIKAWTDLDGDGSFAAAEVIINNAQVNKNGIFTFIFPIPTDADLRGFSRFRISTSQIGDPIGEMPDGEVEDVMGGGVGGLDYGDALDHFLPSPLHLPYGYPTRLVNDGARHFPNPFVRLGQTSTDGELNGFPSMLANGDDNFFLEDENGIRFKDGFVPIYSGPDPDNPNRILTLYSVTKGRTVNLQPLATASGYLNAWIDWNRDGDWDELGEKIFDDEPIISGPTYSTLFVTVPSTAPIGFTYLRFRYSTRSGLDYVGGSQDGEVEDYIVDVLPPVDLGDAPEPYPTTFVENGAYHFTGAFYLGTSVDPDFDGNPDAAALGDDNTGNDDEDGIEFITPLIPGQPARLAVTYHTPDLSMPGYLSAWIDYDHDSTWNNGEERILNEFALAGTWKDTLSFTLPVAAKSGKTYARFRFADTFGSNHPTGPGVFDSLLATYGEVEDYMVAIVDTATEVPPITGNRLPDKYELFQNYPNPFNPITTIQFALPKRSSVRLEIFNPLGEQEAILIDQNVEAGYHSVQWRAGNTSSGIYIYRLKTEQITLIRKMILLK